MTARTGMIAAGLMLFAVIGRSQSLIATITLGPNQIGQVKTAQGITTRITFPEAVRDIICGDLYDGTSGKGSFVVQRIDNDVFLKPVVSKGLSNLFVKTGERGEHTYSFDLQVVSLDQAHRVINVADAPIARAREAQPNIAPEDSKKPLSTSQQQADEIIRTARQQADQILAQANQQAYQTYSNALQRTEQLDRQTTDRAQQEVEDLFLRAMIQGIKEVKTADSRVVVRKASIALDPHVLTFDNKSYLRYSIKNSGDREFSFSNFSLEKRRSGTKESIAIPARVIQGRAENTLKPGETLMGIIMFDSRELAMEDKLFLYVRGDDNAEIARLTIQ